MFLFQTTAQTGAQKNMEGAQVYSKIYTLYQKTAAEHKEVGARLRKLDGWDMFVSSDWFESNKNAYSLLDKQKETGRKFDDFTRAVTSLHAAVGDEKAFKAAFEKVVSTYTDYLTSKAEFMANVAVYDKEGFAFWSAAGLKAFDAATTVSMAFGVGEVAAGARGLALAGKMAFRTIGKKALSTEAKTAALTGISDACAGLKLYMTKGGGLARAVGYTAVLTGAGLYVETNSIGKINKALSTCEVDANKGLNILRKELEGMKKKVNPTSEVAKDIDATLKQIDGTLSKIVGMEAPELSKTEIGKIFAKSLMVGVAFEAGFGLIKVGRTVGQKDYQPGSLTAQYADAKAQRNAKTSGFFVPNNEPATAGQGKLYTGIPIDPIFIGIRNLGKSMIKPGESSVPKVPKEIEPVYFGRPHESNPKKLDIEIIGDASVSRNHGSASFEGGKWKYTDTSTNGTTVVATNGAQHKLANGESWYLKDGDEIRIGADAAYRFEKGRFNKVEKQEIYSISFLEDHGQVADGGGNKIYTSTSAKETIITSVDGQHKLAKGENWYLRDGDEITIGNEVAYRFERGKFSKVFQVLFEDAPKVPSNVVKPTTDKVYFGRPSENNPQKLDIEIIGDASVSRNHGYASIEGRDWKYTDTSTNGTTVVTAGGVQRKLAKGESWYLTDGDEIRIGNDAAYRFERGKFSKVEEVEVIQLSSKDFGEGRVNSFKSSSDRLMPEFYENYKGKRFAGGAKVTYSPEYNPYLVQYERGAGYKAGPKVHITLPTSSETQHFDVAKTVFDKLARIAETTGGFDFKFMGGFEESYRMSGSQFGKDFTLYFSSVEAYNKALPYLRELSNNLPAYSGGENAFRAKMVTDGASYPQSNMAGEIPVAPYIATSIRSPTGGNLLVPVDKAANIPNIRALDRLPSTVEYKGKEYYLFTDNDLRYSERQTNDFLWAAYSQGGVLEVPKNGIPGFSQN